MDKEGGVGVPRLGERVRVITRATSLGEFVCGLIASNAAVCADFAKLDALREGGRSFMDSCV